MKPSELSAELRRIATALDNSKKPNKARVASALKGLLGRVAAETKTQQEWEAQFYTGGVGPLSEDERGSQGFWGAFAELGWRDWTPASDPAVVEAKLREQAARGEFPAEHLEATIEELHDNFNSYKSYEPAYMSGELQSYL